MSDEELLEWVEEQAALRRVATLVARGVPPEELFAAVVEEVGLLLPVEYIYMGRYEPDRTITFVACSSATGDSLPPVGSRLVLGGNNVGTLVFETACPARFDGIVDASGPIGSAFRVWGVQGAVGTPIVVEGRLWGVMIAISTLEQPIPADTDWRLANFTELLATAIANTESRAGLARLAEEQAALRRVATLVARGMPQEELFAAVTEEVGKLLCIEYAGLNRYESDGRTMSIVAVWGRTGDPLPPGGRRQMIGGRNVSTIVFETGRAARIDCYADASGPLGLAAREYGIGSGVGTPIVVEGRLWGAMSIYSTPDRQPLPADAEARLASFTGLVATAIANAESRTGVAQLADEQAALRRGATLVARGTPPEELFAAVTEEVGRLLPVEYALMGCYGPDGTLAVVGAWGGRKRPRRGWQPPESWREEPRDDRVRNRAFCPDGQLCRCLRSARGRNPRVGCPLGGRDADHRRGPRLGRRDRRLAPGAAATGTPKHVSQTLWSSWRRRWRTPRAAPL